MDTSKNHWINWHEFMPAHEADNRKFGSSAVVSKFGFLLGKQALLMNEIPFSLESKRLSLARSLLMGISSNALAIIQLAKHNFGNEVYPIARSLLERVITFYYLQFCDEQEIQNYIDYSRQKTFRNLSGHISVNDKQFQIKYSGTVDLNDYPDIKAAVEKYTSKNSRKALTRWSSTSIEDKLSVIDKAKDINIEVLMIAVQAIYDDASEALHGTLYGCTFHLGAFKPGLRPKSQEAIADQHKQNLAMIFFTCACLLGKV